MEGPEHVRRRGRRRGNRSASRRIAAGTSIRAAAELLAKPASLIFYIVLARQLGEDEFGEFIFALSLSIVLLAAAGLGTKDLVARQVARRHSRVDSLLWNVLAVKAVMAVALLGVVAVIVTLKGFSAEASVSALIIGFGVACEYQTNIFNSVFQAFERQQHIATSLLINRYFTATAGIAALLAGSGLLFVSILFSLGSLLGLLSSHVLLHRYVVRARVRIDPSEWPDLLRSSLPLGVLEVTSTAALRSSVVILGLLAASTVEVGQYGAAFRLIEACLFIPWSFSSAIVPWFARHDASHSVSLGRGFGLALKFVIAAMLPIALVLSIFAEPIIDTLYGSQYGGAVEPLQILGPMAVLWGVNSIVSALLIGRGAPRIYLVPGLASIALNVIISLLLVPDHGSVGAAIATLTSVTVLALATVRATSRLTGGVSATRILTAPLIALAIGGLVGILAADVPWFLGAMVVGATCIAAFLTIERARYPSDFVYLARLLPGR